jgi:autophagy-related protein 9
MGHRFEDADLEQLLAEGLEDDIPVHGNIRLPEDEQKSPQPDRNGSTSRAGPSSRQQFQRPPLPIVDDDDDDDVPESLLLDGKPEKRRRRRSKPVHLPDDHEMPGPGPETQKARAQWEATRAQQRLHGDVYNPRQANQHTTRPVAVRTPFIVDPKERATYMWANVENLDKFLGQVYLYYEEHGIWSILLRRAVAMVTAVFVFCLTTFVFFCVDYTKLPGSSKLEDVRVAKCTQK